MSYLLVRGDACRIPLADESVHCVCTSPPYWGLRSYLDDSHALKHCELGLEADPATYCARMVAVFKEVRRVLHPSGTVFMNIGDSYNASPPGNKKPMSRSGLNGAQTSASYRARLEETQQRQQEGRRLVPGLKPKDMVGIPWMLAFALRDDGWWLRSEIIWSKLNPMPESVNDRPTKAHEQVFLLTRQGTYFYDAEAVRQPAPNNKNLHMKSGRNFEASPLEKRRAILIGESSEPPTSRNLRSVLSIATEAYPGSHFATFPRKLVEPFIRAGSSERGCCPRCRAPWRRVVEVGTLVDDRSRRWDCKRGRNVDDPLVNRWSSRTGEQLAPNRRYERSTLGWHPSCQCPPHEPVPCLVLDPFAGTSTTGVVALALGRNYVGLDLSAEYLGQSKRRIERPHQRPVRPARQEDHPLFAGMAENS